jgi:hypothetical protein
MHTLSKQQLEIAQTDLGRQSAELVQRRNILQSAFIPQKPSLVNDLKQKQPPPQVLMEPHSPPSHAGLEQIPFWQSPEWHYGNS